MCRAIIRAKIVFHTMFRADRSLFRTDVASSSDCTFHSLTEVPRIIKFLFFIFALCYFSVFLFFYPSRLSFLTMSPIASITAISFLTADAWRRRDFVCAREFSDTFTFQLCLDSDRYFKEPLFAYRYVYIHTCINAYSLRSVRKFNDNLLFCILEYRKETNLLIQY